MAEEPLLETVDVPHDLEEESTLEFIEEALKNIRGHLQSNVNQFKNMSNDGVEEVEEILEVDNVDHIQIRARAFENPRVTVWLKDCPTHANDAWNDKIYPKGMNAYNGKVYTTFDVRQF